MASILTDVGEEYLVENNASGETLSVTLYNDSTDTITDADNLAAITTEPAGASFARQSSTVSTAQISGNFGFDNDSVLTFDVSDSTQTVDAAAIIVNFQSDTVAGDSAATDNLIAVADLSQGRDLSQIDTLEIAAGDLDVTLD